jgi:hypothetical protein
MANGREVPMVNFDRQFHYFTPPPRPRGEAMISATAQRAQGGVNTRNKKIVLQ